MHQTHRFLDSAERSGALKLEEVDHTIAQRCMERTKQNCLSLGSGFGMNRINATFLVGVFFFFLCIKGKKA